jgi:hypothetical protein
MALNEGEIAIVKGMLLWGDRQHDIAAYFGVNGGRVAEISTPRQVPASRRHHRKIYRQPGRTWPDDQHCERETC